MSANVPKIAEFKLGFNGTIDDKIWNEYDLVNLDEIFSGTFHFLVQFLSYSISYFIAL